MRLSVRCVVDFCISVVRKPGRLPGTDHVELPGFHEKMCTIYIFCFIPSNHELFAESAQLRK